MAYLTNAKVKLPNGKTKDTHKVPDMPVATITYDKVEGRFTHKDGTVRILTGGLAQCQYASGTHTQEYFQGNCTPIPKKIFISELDIKSGVADWNKCFTATPSALKQQAFTGIYICGYK